jgi:peroxin-10
MDEKNSIIDDRTIPPHEITLRAIQKDNEYVDILSVKLAEFYDSATNFFPLPNISDKFSTISNIVYYYLSYIKSPQKSTPGEEYVKVKKNKGKSILYYLILLSLRTQIITYIQDKLNEFIRKRHSYESRSLYERFVTGVTKLIPSLEDLSVRFEDLQLCYFFINKKYFDFTHWLCGVYNLTRVKGNDSLISEDGFKLLGYLILSRYIIEGYNGMKKVYNVYKEEKESVVPKEESISSSLKLKVAKAQLKSGKEGDMTCLLCMDERKDTSATLCGHLFCWDCITKYLQTKESCPFCRAVCLPQQVIFLQNYK